MELIEQIKQFLTENNWVYSKIDNYIVLRFKGKHAEFIDIFIKYEDEILLFVSKIGNLPNIAREEYMKQLLKNNDEWSLFKFMLDKDDNILLTVELTNVKMTKKLLDSIIYHYITIVEKESIKLEQLKKEEEGLIFDTDSLDSI